VVGDGARSPGGDGTGRRPSEVPPVTFAENEIIHDWNSVEKFGPIIHNRFTVFDETLRDGIQSPSVTDPRIDDKIRILHLLDEIGVDHVNIGLPGAGPRAAAP